MERLQLTAEAIAKYEAWPEQQAFRSWTFTLIVNESERLNLIPMGFDRGFNFDDLWHEAVVQALIDPSIYQEKVFPNRRKLKLEMTYDYIRGEQGNEVTDLKPKTTTLDVIISDSSLKELENPSVAGVQKGRVRDQTLTMISFNVVDEDIMEYRDIMISTIVHGDTMKGIMELFLRPGATPKPDPRPPVLKPEPYWFGQYKGIVGCQITPPDNSKIYPQAIIPFDTKLMELPEYLQENFGVYENGIASCIDRGMVYVFPVMDWDRFDKEVRTLTVINADPTAFAGLSNTYYADDQGKVEVISTGQVRHIDHSDMQQRKYGLGTVWIDADTFLDGGIGRNPDDTIFAARGELMRGTADVQRSDGLTRKRWSSEVITANHYVEETRERMKRTSVVTMEWSNSNHNVVYPGMPTKVLTQIGEKMVEIPGTLIAVHSAERRVRDNLQEPRFMSNSMLTILIPAIGR